MTSFDFHDILFEHYLGLMLIPCNHVSANPFLAPTNTYHWSFALKLLKFIKSENEENQSLEGLGPRSVKFSPPVVVDVPCSFQVGSIWCSGSPQFPRIRPTEPGASTSCSPAPQSWPLHPFRTAMASKKNHFNIMWEKCFTSLINMHLILRISSKLVNYFLCVACIKLLSLLFYHRVILRVVSGDTGIRTHDRSR